MRVREKLLYDSRLDSGEQAIPSFSPSCLPSRKVANHFFVDVKFVVRVVL